MDLVRRQDTHHEAVSSRPFEENRTSSDLFGELLLAQFVQRVELPAEDLVVTETCTSQFDPHDDGSVWDHHGYRAELDLQVLWEFLTTSIARVLENQEVTGKVCALCLKKMSFCSVTGGDVLKEVHQPENCVGSLHSEELKEMINTRISNRNVSLQLPT